jgi:hypothetical protein
VEEWLRKVRDLDLEGRIDDSLDVLYEHADDLMLEGRFSELDGVVGQVDVEGMSLDLMIGFLTITNLAKEHLPSRATLVTAIETRIREIAPEREESLLRGLR